MAADEAGKLTSRKANRRELIDSKIAEDHERVVSKSIRCSKIWANGRSRTSRRRCMPIAFVSPIWIKWAERQRLRLSYYDRLGRR